MTNAQSDFAYNRDYMVQKWVSYARIAIWLTEYMFEAHLFSMKSYDFVRYVEKF